MHTPAFLAIHFQEVGGKCDEHSIEIMKSLITSLKESGQLKEYSTSRVYLDTDYEENEKFTALGCAYFFHESLSEINQWDFQTNSYKSISGHQEYFTDLDELTEIVKIKYPKEMFPEMVWSRKGFMFSRWKFNARRSSLSPQEIAQCEFGLINIHLFHDICNVAAAKNPRLYSNHRRCGLLFAMSKWREMMIRAPIKQEVASATPANQEIATFVFGDFNFRLNANRLIRDLAGQSSSLLQSDVAQLDQQSGKSNFTNNDPLNERANHTNCNLNSNTDFDHDDNDERYRESPKLQFNRFEAAPLSPSSPRSPLLIVKRRLFDFTCNQLSFWADWKKLLTYDEEVEGLRDANLFELEKSFPLSYPFNECPADSYSNTRCPAWCDRVLFNAAASNQLARRARTPPKYDMIGRADCIGDHKPIYMYFAMDST